MTAPEPALTKVKPVEAAHLLDVADTPLAVEGRPSCWLVGTHGGAGVTTLARTFAPFAEAGQVIPAANDPATVVLVAATHLEGLCSVHRAITQFRANQAGEAQLLGVILVDTAPPVKNRKLAKTLSSKRSVIEGATNVWSIPYIPEWRAVETSALPEWSPHDEQEAEGKKKRTKVDATAEVPPAVAEIGNEVHTAAVDHFRQLHP